MAHQRNFWIPVICGAIILTIGIGARQSFGIFQKPIAADLNVGRELWSFSNALALLLMGVFAPFAGNLADRFGTARTVGAGGALYVAGMLMIAMASEGVMLTVGNALAGIGMAAAGFGPILGAIGRQTPVEWRSSALGIAPAGGSFGQFAIVPFASILQNRLCARIARQLQRPPVRAGPKAARMRCKKHFALRASGCSRSVSLCAVSM